MNRVLLIVLLFFSLTSFETKSQNQNPILAKNPTEYLGMKFPKPIGYVNDFSKIFDSTQVIELDKIIAKYERKTTNEIVIVTIDSIEPYNDIHLYSTDLGQNWLVGKKEKNNGLVILLCKNIGQVSISTGYGTEKILTDPICNKVIDSTMIPEFKKGNLYKGMKNGLEELITIWE